MIWLAIAQGFAQHIGNNPETLREAFVLHQGQATITVERPDFVLGDRDGTTCAPEFTALVADAIRDGYRFSEKIMLHQ